MIFRQFLKTLGGTGAAFGLFAACSAQESLVTNVATFQIPFDVDGSSGQPVDGFAVLFGSRDGGAWEKLQTVPAQQQNFQFSAPRDGSYGFAVRMMDAQGNLQSSVDGSAPELEVIVDSEAPQLHLEISEIAPGQVVVSWHCVDPRVDPQTLSIEFTEGRDSRWKPLRCNATAAGQSGITVVPGAVVSVRGTVSDTAGNRGESSAQLVLNAVRTPSSQPTTNQPATSSSGQAIGPSPFTTPPTVPGAGGFGQSTSGASNATAWGNPSAVMNNTSTAGFAAGLGSPPAAGDSTNTMFRPNGAGDFPSADGSLLVNSSTFDIAYEIDDVGPSGVSAVELFVTEDGGQQWWKYGSDDDLRSPFQVDVQGEGTFGFAVRVRNGLGFADAPPQPGEAPTIVVSVDQTAPQIDFPQPTLTAEGNGAVLLNWRTQETGSGATAVRLEFATAAAGPWTPVVDWQPDPASYQWSVRPGTAAAVYFRLLARDAAGNIGFAQPPQPVMIDLKRPVARGLRVQAASSTSPAVPR